MRAVDPRLREVVAMALCWAEFADHRSVEGSVEGYWSQLTSVTRARYYHDAEQLALVMMGERLSVVPDAPTKAMVSAARAIRPALRRDSHVEEVWRDMLAAAPRFPSRSSGPA